MWDALHDLTLIILLIAGVVSLVIGVAFEEDKAVCAVTAILAMFGPLSKMIYATLVHYDTLYNLCLLRG